MKTSKLTNITAIYYFFVVIFTAYGVWAFYQFNGHPHPRAHLIFFARVSVSVLLSVLAFCAWMSEYRKLRAGHRERPKRLGSVGIPAVFGVPDWVAAMLGVDSKLIQKATIRFDNKKFAMAEVEFAPDADALRESFEGTKLIIYGPEKDGKA